MVPLFLPAAAVAAGMTAPYLEAVLTYDTPSAAPASPRQSCRATALGVARQGTAEAKVAEFRCETVTVGSEAVRLAVDGRGRSAQKSVRELGLRMRPETVDLGTDAAAAQKLAALHADVSGRMEKALQVGGEERELLPPPFPLSSPPPTRPPADLCSPVRACSRRPARCRLCRRPTQPPHTHHSHCRDKSGSIDGESTT